MQTITKTLDFIDLGYWPGSLSWPSDKVLCRSDAVLAADTDPAEKILRFLFGMKPTAKSVILSRLTASAPAVQVITVAAPAVQSLEGSDPR
jgi:23S rRNA U2552 (ribose-2'-O)-methylase RlmE/FtsJ